MKTVSVESKDLLPLIEETISKDMSFTIKVKGNSMYPFLVSDQSNVILVKTNGLKKNMICLFKYKSNIVLHRLRKIKGDKLFFIGDNNYNYEVVKKEDIIACVREINVRNKVILVNTWLYNFKVNLWYLIKPIRRIIKGIVKRLFNARG